MRSRNLFQIQNRLMLLIFFLLGRALLLRHLILEAAQINHAYTRHVKNIIIIKLSAAHLLIHGVKTSLHTV